MVVNLPNHINEPLPNLPANIRESNIYGIELAGDSLYVVDASFSLLYRVNTIAGNHSIFATFAPKPNPTMTGPPMVEAVPDNIRLVGNQLLVPYLTGFPFVQNLAEIRSVNLQGGAQSTFIPNLTSAIDVLPFNAAGAGDSYLVLEFSANQLAQQSGRLKLFTSRTESPRILVNTLITPTSFARDSQIGSISVTENTPGRIVRVAAPKAAPIDYFSTGSSDYVLLAYSENPSFIRWNFLRNLITSPAQIRQVFWGLVDDYAVFGDTDGDLKMDVGVWQPGTNANPQSNFLIQRSSNPNPNQIFGQAWGLRTDEPIDGDFDGDGKLDITVFRPTNTTFYSLLSSNGQVKEQYFNGNSATPLADKNTLEADNKLIPASALKGVMITKQPDGTFKIERASDFYFKQ